jgi:signal transduction histidine kinase
MPDISMKSDISESLIGIEENVEYISKIVNDLQDYVKPLVPDLKETNIELVLDAVLAKRAIPKNIEISRVIQAEARNLISDLDLLKRIFANLINNAIQAMPNGGKLSIQAISEGTDVILTVEDTGMGIPEEVKSKLFQPLFTTKAKGQGFGLAAVKRMTEALGGTITFESQEGKGTKFIIRLPRQ